MFKGFGKKPKPTQDDLQLFVADTLSTIVSDKTYKDIGLSQNKLFCLLPQREITDTTNDRMTWEIYTKPIRWDLLNPGQPNLVPFQASTSGAVMTLEETGQSMLAAVYDRAKGLMSFALNLDQQSEEKMTVVTIDLATKEVTDVLPEAKTQSALKRLTQWISYRTAVSFLSGEHSVLLPEIAEEIGLDLELLQSV